MIFVLVAQRLFRLAMALNAAVSTVACITGICAGLRDRGRPLRPGGGAS